MFVHQKQLYKLIYKTTDRERKVVNGDKYWNKIVKEYRERIENCVYRKKNNNKYKDTKNRLGHSEPIKK